MRYYFDDEVFTDSSSANLSLGIAIGNVRTVPSTSRPDQQVAIFEVDLRNIGDIFYVLLAPFQLYVAEVDSVVGAWYSSEEAGRDIGQTLDPALQDAFVEIWRKASGFDAERGKAEAWMAVITRNRAIDLVRKRGRGPTFGTGGADDEEWMTALPDPSKPTDGGAEMIALQECLNRLEDQQRDMVLLAYYKGLSREELAAKFETPVNTVKTWLRRGLASLKTCLDE